jgi:hypothetical protein
MNGEQSGGKPVTRAGRGPTAGYCITSMLGPTQPQSQTIFNKKTLEGQASKPGG